MTIKRQIRTLLSLVGEAFYSPSIKEVVLRKAAAEILDQIRAKTPRNPAANGFKVFSQTDEDGIIEDIFHRIGEGHRFFVEFGCGDGTQNNSHYLLLKNWRGGWIDGNPKHVSHIATHFPLKTKRLWVRNEFVRTDNAVELVEAFMLRAAVQDIDFFSLDIDGNDLYVVGEVARKFKPRVIGVEYNGKFPPPLALSIAYNPTHTWAQDDYHGASLQSFVNTLHEYLLVACSISGANAFFIRRDLAQDFDQYPVSDLYQPARHHLVNLRNGPPSSLKYLRDSLQDS